MKEPDKREQSAVLADNMQKYENYKEQFKRLNRALANGFNLEAVCFPTPRRTRRG